ncbi:MAG: ispD [Dehalococcoidia bacterium]|nr:ispD [Dehalococcoidia bacterium]
MILGAGNSSRMDGTDKVFAPLGEYPLLFWSVSAFQRCSAVHRIVLVMNHVNLPLAKALVDEAGLTKVHGVLLGGQRRQDSVYEGLKALEGCQWVMIHDGARPLVSEEIIIRGLLEARKTSAAVPGVPVKDTIKRVDREGIVTRTLRRQRLWAIQTPQVFRYDVILDAHQRVSKDVTDDASMVELCGGTVTIFPGSPFNLKVTEPDDLILAEALLRSHASRDGV